MPNKHEMDPNYHYNRDEYEKSRHSEHIDFKEGPFKQNRTLIITLLDIAVIVLIIMLVLPFLRKPYKVPNLNGYKLELTSYPTEEEIFLNLLITNKTKTDIAVATLVDIEFSMGNIDDTIYINDLLPLPSESITYRVGFKNNESENATAKVSILDKSTVLNIKVNKQ